MDNSNHHIQPYTNSSIVYTPHILPSGTLTYSFADTAPLTPRDIQNRIRANEGGHAAFVLGQNLRYMWDTTIQSIRSTWDTTTGILSDIYSSFKSLRASHFINEEDFDYQVHQNINAETCVPGYEEQCEKGYPQAIVLHGDYFRDSLEKFLDETIIENSPRNQIFLNTLTKQHRVHNLKISVDKNLCDIILQVSELGPIRFLFLNMHGSPYEIITFKHDDPYNFKNKIHIFSFYYTFYNYDLSCLKFMDEQSVIILNSCNTGKEVDLCYSSNDYKCPMNVQKLFALHAPQSKVFAPDFYTMKNTLVIKQDANSKIQVYSHGIDSESYLYGALDCLKLALPIFSSELLHLYTPYLGDFFLKPFKEVSTEKAEFCKELLPYFLMKQFCDKAKIQPEEQKISECENDVTCKKGLDYTVSLNKRQFKI